MACICIIANMKKGLIFFFVFGLLFAVKPVYKEGEEKNNLKQGSKLEMRIHNEEDKAAKAEKKIKQERKDQFQDADSNSVNDSREDDLQRIKWLKTKFKDLLKEKSQKEQPKKSKKSR